jgi:hypothetical protein
MDAAPTREFPMPKTQFKHQTAPRKTKSKARTRVTTARRPKRRPSSRDEAQRHPTKNVARTDSKQAHILALLQASTGTSIDAMAKATGWQPHSVRGFLSAVVRKKLGLNLISEPSEAGRIYRIKDGKTSSALKA